VTYHTGCESHSKSCLILLEGAIGSIPFGAYKRQVHIRHA
jgi:hypothetical protein